MTAYERKKKSVTTTNSGKIPPQAVDLEKSILGCLMLERNKIYEVIDILKPDMFYDEPHKLIYSAIATLYSQRHPFDFMSVTQQLKSMGNLEMVGGSYYVLNLTNGVAGTEQLEYWARIVMEKHLQRELIRNSSEIIHEAYEDTSDPFETLGKLSNFVANAEVGFISSNEQTVSDVMLELTRHRVDNKDEVFEGISTGNDELDKLLNGGFGGGELISIGARPAMGKTAVIVSIASKVSIEQKIPLAIFSLEMSKRQIVMRMESNISGIDGKKIKNKNLADWEWHTVGEADMKISNGNLIIDDCSSLNINQLISRIRMYVRKYGIKGVLLDYLQLLNGLSNKPGNRESEISTMTRALKVCAQELNIPIVILCQLSREVEKRRPFCIPGLADLRESGAIEQDCDKVIFLWRPEYYLTEDMQEDQKLGIGTTTTFRLFSRQIPNKNLLVWIVAKHREGELGNVPSLFTPWNMRVLNHPDLESPLQSISDLKPRAEQTVIFAPNELNKDNPDDEPESPF